MPFSGHLDLPGYVNAGAAHGACQVRGRQLRAKTQPAPIAAGPAAACQLACWASALPTHIPSRLNSVQTKFRHWHKRVRVNLYVFREYY